MTTHPTLNLHSSDYNWDTFLEDMDGSLVDMNVEFTGNVVKMTSTITTTTKKVYNYSFSMKLTQPEDKVVLFFVNEGSYIDGSKLSHWHQLSVRHHQEG